MAFIVFEGLDGSGKSSLLRALESLLQHKNITFHRTREPGGTPLGEDLREIILRRSQGAPGPRTELLLYEASRAQHVDEVIRPQLKRGAWVLCDRFTASSIAFQAGGRSIRISDVEWLNRFATNGLEPDLTVLLDLETNEAKMRVDQRLRQTGESADRMESEATAFHERLRSSFLQQAEGNPKKWLVLDAKLSPQELIAELVSALRERGFL